MPSTHNTITIYEPNQRARTGWLRTWLVLIQHTVEHRELIWQLFKRDFLMMHKKSFLGMGWLILAPIIGIISWVLMNSTGILQPGDVGIPYPAYVLISSSIWGLFMQFFNNTSNSLQVAQAFILQVGFPHEILVVKQALQTAASFAITLVITIVALTVFGVIPHWPIILSPLFVLPLFFLGGAIGMLVSIIKTVTPDAQRGVSFLMGLLMFITPVIYAKDVKNDYLQAAIHWNPLTYLVGGMRDAIVFGHIDNPERYAMAAAGSFVVFLLSWRLFFVSEERVIEKLI